MFIEKHHTLITEVFVLKDGPRFVYMSKRGRGQLAEMRVRRVEFRFANNLLNEIAVIGIRLRADGTEISWEKPTHVIERKWADSTPEWLQVIMRDNGWAWRKHRRNA